MPDGYLSGIFFLPAYRQSGNEIVRNTQHQVGMKTGPYRIFMHITPEQWLNPAGSSGNAGDSWKTV